MRRGALQAGEKVQFCDRKGKKITEQLVPGGVTQTEHGLIVHDDVIGRTEGVVVTTVTAKRERTDAAKPWKAARAIGGWQYAVMRPRLADYVLSMPRGAQIMYPKDIAQVIQLGDIRKGHRVLESGAGSGAMSVNLLDAVGETGSLTTIELRADFARVAEANATLYYGERPQWWDLQVGDFDSVAATLQEHSYDRIMLDMLDPWNRLEQAYRVIAPGGVLVCYVTTTTQMSRLAEALRESGVWTEPDIQETLERSWKAQGLAVLAGSPDDRAHRLPDRFSRHGGGLPGVEEARSRHQGHGHRHRRPDPAGARGTAGGSAAARHLRSQAA